MIRSIREFALDESGWTYGEEEICEGCGLWADYCSCPPEVIRDAGFHEKQGVGRIGADAPTGLSSLRDGAASRLHPHGLQSHCARKRA